MLCIRQNQTVSFNGSNAVSSELMPNLNLSCDVDFTDINLTDFPIDVPLEDSLDQMFNQREFDQIGLESGYSTTGTTTPETITVTDSQPNLSLGFRFDQISDRPNQGSVIGSTETSMSSAPTTPSSATLPSFMEIYSPRVPLQAGSTTTATLTSSTSTSTINPQSTVSPVDHSNETFFKFDDIGLEEDTSLSEVSFETINKKLTGQSTSISSVDLGNIGFNIKQESEASSPVSPSLSLISNSFESGQFSSHNLAEIPFTCVPSNRTATLSSTLSPPPISSAFKSVNTSQNYSSSSLATIGGASSSSSASTNQLESIRSYTSLSRSSVSSVTTPKSIYEGSSGRRSTSTTSSGESSPNDLSIQKQSIQYEGLSCHRRVQQHEIRRQTQHQSQHHQSQQHHSSQASTANQSQSQLCAVCGDNAACQHYGVRTCEGCKGFFKRTVQKGSKYVCLGSKDCPVDKRRRNRCQFCRFQKCLAVGMVKEVVRTDNLKGRRGRLPSKPKSPQENPPSPPISMITALVRAHVDTSPDISNLDFSRYHELSECEAEEFCESDKEQFVSLLSSSLEVCRNFGEKIPGFTELDKYDQELLFYSSCLEIFALRFVYQNKPGSAKIVLPNGNVLHRDQVKQLFGDWFINLELFSQRFAQIDIDISAFACLTALSLVTVRHGLKDAFRVESLQMKIIESLRDHVTYNAEAQKKSHYFSSILSKLPDLRSLTMDGLTHLHGIKLQSTVTLPDSISKLFSTILYF